MEKEKIEDEREALKKSLCILAEQIVGQNLPRTIPVPPDVLKTCGDKPCFKFGFDPLVTNESALLVGKDKEVYKIYFGCNNGDDYEIVYFYKLSLDPNSLTIGKTDGLDIEVRRDVDGKVKKIADFPVPIDDNDLAFFNNLLTSAITPNPQINVVAKG
jgi:hypothetical protein